MRNERKNDNETVLMFIVLKLSLRAKQDALTQFLIISFSNNEKNIFQAWTEVFQVFCFLNPCNILPFPSLGVISGHCLSFLMGAYFLNFFTLFPNVKCWSFFPLPLKCIYTYIFFFPWWTQYYKIYIFIPRNKMYALTGYCSSDSNVGYFILISTCYFY